jgi:prepilin-type N-terminal cleavage/methylation domain-containing protein
MTRTARTTARAGFTLVELMVVIIVLGLIGGVAMTSWASLLPNQQFNSAIRQL